jgi:hypothetical protein
MIGSDIHRMNRGLFQLIRRGNSIYPFPSKERAKRDLHSPSQTDISGNTSERDSPLRLFHQMVDCCFDPLRVLIAASDIVSPMMLLM